MAPLTIFRPSTRWHAAYGTYYFHTLADAQLAGYDRLRDAPSALDDCLNHRTGIPYDRIMLYLHVNPRIATPLITTLATTTSNTSTSTALNPRAHHTMSISRVVEVRLSNPLLKPLVPADAAEIVRDDPVALMGPTLLWVLSEGGMTNTQVWDAYVGVHGWNIDISTVAQRKRKALEAVRGWERYDEVRKAFAEVEKCWRQRGWEEEGVLWDSGVGGVEALFWMCGRRGGVVIV
ncbi:hypothetical protein LTS18_012886 [Coniosporium uncinatum]|uniref:Uncharacterized protein n=1 Tax=Coniosporium uncinatum TaxID=93489 RepID=A0ACC3DW00_9PEZI|nr:hypothetical protein LTS18_012886 [Coniosporium uncinatum]